MKKILFTVIAFLAISTASFAQKVESKQKVKTKITQSTPPQTVTKTKTKATSPDASVPTTTKLKKDGTPDKRFKENKVVTNKSSSGPLKKDGTPDKRFKANKKA